MRLSCPLRQIVFRVDHLRGAAFRPRQRLERVTPLRARAEIHAAQVLGLTPPGLLLPFGLDSTYRTYRTYRSAANPRRRSFLNHQREGERRVSGHAADDAGELDGVVARSRHQFQRVAVRAAAHGGLLLITARKAREPLGIRELRR